MVIWPTFSIISEFIVFLKAWLEVGVLLKFLFFFMKAVQYRAHQDFFEQNTIFGEFPVRFSTHYTMLNILCLTRKISISHMWSHQAAVLDLKRITPQRPSKVGVVIS